MPALQYSNPNKPFKLFTHVSKHCYSRIFHQEKEGQADAEKPELIPTAYISGTFNKTQQLWNTTQKECYAIDQFRNLLSVLQVSTAHCIVTTNLNTFLYYRNV